MDRRSSRYAEPNANCYCYRYRYRNGYTYLQRHGNRNTHANASIRHTYAAAHPNPKIQPLATGASNSAAEALIAVMSYRGSCGYQLRGG